jgi:hypothetical protein
MTQREIMETFAEVYYTALPHYKNSIGRNDDLQSTKRFKSEFYQSLKWLIKHCGTLVPPKASKKAKELAAIHEIDIFALQWKDQPAAEERICGRNGREIFIHEHEIPVTDLFNQILNADSKTKILEILMSQSIVWILREEERLLHRYIRDENSYRDANIEPLDNEYKDEWMEKPWDLNKTCP